MVKDRGAVISTDVRPLAVQLRRVMDRPEDIEELFESDPGWIIDNLHHFCVAGLRCAYIFIGGIFR